MRRGKIWTVLSSTLSFFFVCVCVSMCGHSLVFSFSLMNILSNKEIFNVNFSLTHTLFLSVTLFNAAPLRYLSN